MFGSLAASLLASGSTAPVAVGFGGYAGSSRLDTSLASEDSNAFVVNFRLEFVILA